MGDAPCEDREQPAAAPEGAGAAGRVAVDGEELVFFTEDLAEDVHLLPGEVAEDGEELGDVLRARNRCIPEEGGSQNLGR